MPLAPKQRHKLVMAVRTGDAGWIGAVVEDLLAANPDISLPEIERELRSAAAKAYLVAAPDTAAGFEFLLGEFAFRRRVAAAGMTAE